MARHARSAAFEIAENVHAAAIPEADRREQAQVILGLAEYLAPDLKGHPERAERAVATLAEWTDGDAALLARARAAAVRDATFERMHQEAVDLLGRAARAS
jgi:hypothetical protein